MAESRLPDEVRALVQRHLGSMAHLEALLRLVRSPDESLPLESVASAIGVAAEAAAATLRDLKASCLVALERADGGVRYRFAPGDESLRHAAESLAHMYSRYPVQVIRAVYERPPFAGQPLAEASRMKR
jgi:hypothetical protein